MSDFPLTQLAAISVIPLLIFLAFRYFGDGKLHGYMALAGGLIFLLVTLVLNGALDFASQRFSSQSASCTAEEFFALSGGIGCSVALVATAYAAMIYGLANLVGFYARKASKAERDRGEDEDPSR